MEKLTLENLRTAAEPPKVKGLSEEMLEFAERAQSVLGYRYLLTRMREQPLAKLLLRLEIDVIPTAMVQQYQAQLIEELTGFKPKTVAFEVNLDDDEDDDEDEEEDDDRPMKVKASGARVERPPYFGRRLRWHSIEIRAYHKAVPEHVLLKAMQIKCEAPQTQIWVQELQEHPDPFLLVSMGSEKYYVEVWDEPKFEGRLPATKSVSKAKKVKSADEEDEF
jgi:hypothetical protein